MFTEKRLCLTFKADGPGGDYRLDAWGLSGVLREDPHVLRMELWTPACKACVLASHPPSQPHNHLLILKWQ